MGRADRQAELRAEGRLPGHLSAGEEARFRRSDVQEHEGRRRPARARGRVAGDEPRELVDRLLRAVARATQGAYAQPGEVRSGYAARAEGDRKSTRLKSRH